MDIALNKSVLLNDQEELENIEIIAINQKSKVNTTYSATVKWIYE